ncbi:hypothetical protein J3Q64DRAFT_1416854 [Phycomyces blakesleeanus]|uniref:Cora-domain-containing protein n=1 Tax=Phycomyces blakesleeanus TaxID=4837 RepID=A0ABR3AK16_PHYBL
MTDSASQSMEHIVHMDSRSTPSISQTYNDPLLRTDFHFGSHSPPNDDTELQTINQGDMQAFMEHSGNEDTRDRPFTARLDDLLETNEKKPMPRRKSLYGGQVYVEKHIERCEFYSPDLGCIKSNSLRKMMEMPVRTEEEKTVSEVLVETSNWWINMMSPTDDEMRSLGKLFRIHPLTTEDIQAQESREKCEIFQNYIFINYRTFESDYVSPNYLEPINFYILLFKNGVLTFHFQPVPHPYNVRKRIHHLKDFIHITPEWINYAIIDDITDSFGPLIQQTELEVDSIDDLVLVLSGSEQNDMLRRIGSCRKIVMHLLRLLGTKADVIRSLIKRHDDKAVELGYGPRTRDRLGSEGKVYQEVLLYFGDIQDHIITMVQNVTHYDLILGRAHRNYLGQISIELSQAGATTNDVVNRLTFLATIAVPLNLVAGLFGMNVKVPGSSEDDLVWFFWIVLGMGFFSAAMVGYGKRAGFL